MFGKTRHRKTDLPHLSEALQRTIVTRTAARLRNLSSHDPVTSLLNRATFRSRFAKILTKARVGNRCGAVLFLSIDPYRRIRETLGPAVADNLVQCAARRLKTIINKGNLIGYWGGDEFVVLLNDLDDRDQAVEMVAKIQEQLKPAFVTGSHEIYITSSIGIGIYPYHGLNVETVLSNAASALLRAKGLGGNHYRVYAPDMNAKALERLSLENSLRRALDRQEFILFYQPQISTETWRVVAAEALIRWRHPELGLLSPAQFIPLAEETGLIVSIGEWVTRSACKQLKRWHADGFPKLEIAVNISAREFQEHDPAETIVPIMNETQLDPKYLTLELTETSLMGRAESVVRSLERLSDLGVKLSVDDFGTGFSSFEYLRRLPLDILKIDESFVRHASRDRDDGAVVSAIVELAHKLRLKVIAEGIETEDQLEFMHALDCDAMQGYIFAKPLPAEQFKRLLVDANYKSNVRYLRRADASRAGIFGLRRANGSVPAARGLQLIN